MESDAQVAEMTKATEVMKLEVADTIAALSQMALSGGGGGGGAGAEDGKATATAWRASIQFYTLSVSMLSYRGGACAGPHIGRA